MSIRDKKFLIRFVGGSGGETFASVLESTGQGWLPKESTKDDYNRNTFPDLFNGEFTNNMANTETRVLLSLPKQDWKYLTDDQIKSVVDYRNKKNSAQNIGLSHYPFDRDVDFDNVFNGFTVVDIRPNPEDLWLIRALHFFKSAIRQKTISYSRYVRSEAEKHEFEKHVSDHGWWPEWWAWDGPMTAEEFIRNDLKYYKTALNMLPPIKDALIDSGKMAIRDDQSWMHEFNLTTGIDLSADYNKSYFSSWSAKNREILEFLGLLDHMNKDHDYSKKESLLIDAFARKHEEILEYNRPKKREYTMKMIILVGPQGAGNHLFGKIFSLHEDVHGWKDALKPDGYFIPHYKEPFNWHWNHIDDITVSNTMGGKKYAVTSISNPYIENWLPKVPPIFEMTEKLESLGIEVQHVVIGRDRNILTHQQTRLRGGPTWGNMTQLIRWMKKPPFFISQELLYLYRREYIKSLGAWLDFPMAHDHPLVDEILKEDANEKYVHAADRWWLDDHVQNILTPPDQRDD